MIHAIVEGEPGIFPAPVAQILRKVAGLFRRKKHDEPATEPDPTDEKPTPA